MRDIVESTKAFVEDYVKRYDSSHDFWHVLRVYTVAIKIAAHENRTRHNAGLEDLHDMTVVVLSTLLHDIGDSKYLEPEQNGKTMAYDYLISIGATADLAASVQEVVNHVSYSFETKNPKTVKMCLEKHPELGPVQDADRLDAMGAVGIARCFTFSTARDPHYNMLEPIQHFDEKLLKLGDMMKTPFGRQLALRRTDLMKTFKEQFKAEYSGLDFEPSEYYGTTDMK